VQNAKVVALGNNVNGGHFNVQNILSADYNAAAIDSTVVTFPVGMKVAATINTEVNSVLCRKTRTTNL
jgi:hypothetical protein